MKDLNYFKTALAGLSGVLTYLFGGADAMLLALVAFVVFDYITGLIAAGIAKEVDSRKGLAGILKKVLYFIVVSVSHILDTAMGFGGAVRSMVIGFLIANEGISILENCGKAGLPIPQKLLEILNQLKEKDSE